MAANPVQTPEKLHSYRNKNGAEIRFALGGSVYATYTVGYFRGKLELSVREFYRSRPIRQLKSSNRSGLFLTLEQWRTLSRSITGISAALVACTSAAMSHDVTLFSPCRYHIGNQMYTIVHVSRGVAIVTLWTFFKRRPEFRRGLEDDFDDLLPGRRCLNLSVEQWERLQKHSQKMDMALEGT
ncbi:hypothetical protein Bbelb_110920 [Branchiostoma belcheri]|nr:hypothetical protein Bbelb_110920 [Branchiostoma belcheri]